MSVEVPALALEKITVTPSRFAARQLERLGLPGDRLDVVANYVPDVADASAAHEGAYALAAGRLSVEKGTNPASVRLELVRR